MVINGILCRLGSITKMKKYISILSIIILLLLSSTPTHAHSGRTDSSGGHNCYVGACAGTYHYHNGGSGGYTPPAPRYVLPAPINPQNAYTDFKISSDNWCNQDLIFTWDKPTSGDRFSIAVSKYAGTDPGPSVDTSALSSTFENLTPGRWYVNMKTGNAERWSGIVYWTVDVPKSTPALTAVVITSGDNQYLQYNISCLDKVEGPQEFIDYLETNGNSPSGQVLLSYDSPTTITVKGWDKSGKEYAQNLSFSPLVADAQTDNSNSEESSDSDYWIGMLVILGIMGWVGVSIMKFLKKMWVRITGGGKEL